MCNFTNVLSRNKITSLMSTRSSAYCDTQTCESFPAVGDQVLKITQQYMYGFLTSFDGD